VEMVITSPKRRHPTGRGVADLLRRGGVDVASGGWGRTVCGSPPGVSQTGGGEDADPSHPAQQNPFRLLSAAELNCARYETRYLIPGLLAAGQPGGIFGAFIEPCLFKGD